MANIALYNRASQNLPAFVRDDYETFTAFIACYHTWLELNQADIGLLTNLDTTLDSFISNFKKETNYLNITFPNIDERFLLAHIKKLYLSKGTEESYITLFKLLFDKEVIVKYPDQMTMKLSDGKWQQITSIFVEVVEGDITSMNNHVVQVTNTASSRVINIVVEDTKIRRFGGGMSSIHLSSGGSGYTNPIITLAGGNGSSAAATAVVGDGVISSISLVSGGAAYATTGTSFTGGGTGAKAYAELHNGVVVGVNLISGGSGYTNPTITFTGGGVGAIANLTTTDGVITSIVVNAPGNNYDSAPTVTITGSHTTAAVVSSVQMLMMPNIYECNIDKHYYGSIEVGDQISFGSFRGKILPTINSFTIVDSGKEFRLGQTFDIDTVFGRGSTVKVSKLTATNGIAELKFIKYGYGYVSDFESSNLIPPNISQSTPFQGFSATMFNRVGTFAASTLYYVNDLVFNTSNSTYYYCKLEYTSGSSPTLPPSDGTHWALYLGTEETRIGNFVEYAVADPSGGYVLRETLSTTPPYDFTWVAAITKSTQSITWLANVATVTTTTAHGFTSGDAVSLTGVTPIAYNGVHTITVTSTTAFTFPLVASSVATATVQGSVTTIYELDKVIKSGNNFYKVTTAGQTGATAPTHTSGTVTQGACAFLFLDSSELFALDYAGDLAREFYSSNKYKGDLNNGARINFKLGAVCKYPGSYINSDGMTSDIIKIHDGFLYQKYSYIVQVDKQLDEYKDIVKTFVHPAGTALFGEYSMSNHFSVKLKLTTLLSALSIWHADAVSAVHNEDTDNWFEKLLAVSDDSYVIYGTEASNDQTNISDIDSPTFAQNWVRASIKDVGNDSVTAANVDAENTFLFAAAKSDTSNLNEASSTTLSLTWLANVVTVTTTAAHNLATGDSVQVLNVVPAAYNGSFNITVTGTTTFTYPLVVTNPGTATAQGTVAVEYAYFTKLHTIFDPTDYDISTQVDAYSLANAHEISDASYMLNGQAYFDAYKDWTALPATEASPGATGPDYWIYNTTKDIQGDAATSTSVEGTDNSYVLGSNLYEFVGKNMFIDTIDMSSTAWFKAGSTVVGDLITCTNTTDPFVGQYINTGSKVGDRTFTISADLWIDAGQKTTGYMFYIYDGTVTYVYTSPIVLTTTRTRYSFTATINVLATSIELYGRIDQEQGQGFSVGNTYHAANLQFEENPTATTYAQYPVTEYSAMNVEFLLGTLNALQTTGTAQTAAQSSLTLSNASVNAIDDSFAYNRVTITSGAGVGQVRTISTNRKNFIPNTAVSTWTQYTNGAATVSITAVPNTIYGTVTRITKTAGAVGDRAGALISIASGLSGNSYTASMQYRVGVSGAVGPAIYVDATRVGGGLVTGSRYLTSAETVGVWYNATVTSVGPLAGGANVYVWLQGAIGDYVDFALPQLELGLNATTSIATSGIAAVGVAVSPPWSSNTQINSEDGSGAGWGVLNLSRSRPGNLLDGKLTTRFTLIGGLVSHYMTGNGLPGQQFRQSIAIDVTGMTTKYVYMENGNTSVCTFTWTGPQTIVAVGTYAAYTILGDYKAILFGGSDAWTLAYEAIYVGTSAPYSGDGQYFEVTRFERHLGSAIVPYIATTTSPALLPDNTSVYLIEDRDMYDITDLNVGGDAGVNGVSAITMVKDGQTIASDIAIANDRDTDSNVLYTIEFASNGNADAITVSTESGFVTLNAYVDPDYVPNTYVSGPDQIW